MLRFMEVSDSKHNRSKSMDNGPVKRKIEEDKSNNLQASYRQKLDMEQKKDCVDIKKKQSPGRDVQDSLNQEILELQKRLQEQISVRHALERALTNKPLSLDDTNENLIPKDAMELIKDIAVLEMEVVCLEQYLLSMYRKTFDRQCSEVQEHGIKLDRDEFVFHSDRFSSPSELFDSSIHRSHSSLSQRSTCLARASPSREFLAQAVDSYHSLPLSMLEQSQCANSNTTTQEEHHHGTCVSSDHVPETPNQLSEEMIKSISSIYCKLADPPLDSPFSSSNNEFYPQDNDPLESREFSGPYCALVKIHGICRESDALQDIEHMLQNFRSLVYRLEEVDPRRMKHNQKLAFWINVHNALVMHAFLVYGVPRNNLKRMSLLLKAAYNVGGHNISVNMIQSSILSCRTPRPGQWLRSLFPSKSKFKARDARRLYAIENPEPLLHFGLCSGSHSDPAVRVYTPKNVFMELETAKEEFIGSTISLHKEHKIFLPKIVESFAKDSGSCPAGLVEMIEQFMPSSWRKKNIHPGQQRKVWKNIEWINHNFSFRYLLSRELSQSTA